jgi:hypothetical protein
MDNWLQATLREAGTSLESILEINPEDARYLTVHPGELTLGEVNAIARALPRDIAIRMLDMMRETFAL